MLTAAVGGNKDVASLLLRNNADINARDKDGKTALMIAVVNGHQPLVEILLENKADISIQNEVSSERLGYFHNSIAFIDKVLYEMLK